MSTWILLHQNQQGGVAPDYLNLGSNHVQSDDGSGSPDDINMDALWMIVTQTQVDRFPTHLIVKKYGSHVTISLDKFNFSPTVEGIYQLATTSGANIYLSSNLIPSILKLNNINTNQVNFPVPIVVTPPQPNINSPYVTQGSVAVAQSGAILFENLYNNQTNYHFLPGQGTINTVGAMSFSYSS